MTGFALHLSAILLATLAAVAIPAGALLARVDGIRPGWLDEEFRHGIIAFGGGALLAAIAFVLVPEGADKLPLAATLGSFAAGGVLFGFLDHWLAQRGGHAAQFLAMMLDYLPEAAALGAMIAGQSETAILLAGLITLQNLPESFNAYREMIGAGAGRGIIWLFLAAVPLGPLAAIGGLAFLTEMPGLLGGIMVFSAGGILYLIFEDIAPQVPLERRWGPPLGAVAGFLLGLAGHLVLQ